MTINLKMAAAVGCHVGRHVDDLPTPALLVKESTFKTNCRRMLEAAKEMGNIKLRCQTKTHKTVEGAIVQTGGSKRCLVTSTLSEAEMYADAGFEDILYGHPLLDTHMSRNYALTQKLDQYHVMVANTEGANVLKAWPPPPGKKWSVFMKVSVGYNRSGISPKDESFLALAKALNDDQNVDFRGLYAHCGNSYKGCTVKSVLRVRDESIQGVVAAAKHLGEQGIEVKNLGIGSTPTCSHPCKGMSCLTEIHPGNYVFYDVQQMMLGSCILEDIAATVLVRVLAHFPKRNEMLIDAGFTGLSEQGFEAMEGTYAYVKGHPELMINAMTQEMAYVRPKDPGSFLDMERYPIGSTLQLYQYHGCHVAFHYPAYFVYGDDGIVKEEWRPCRGW